MAELNTEQIRALDRQRTVVLLPGGILEEHGPYLPSYADGYQNEHYTLGLARAIAARPGWSVLLFPSIPLGSGGANEIGGKYSFPGTYAVRPETLRAIFMDLASELGEQGFRWIFVLHSHGSPDHNRMLDQAGDFFRDTYGGRMVHLLGFRGEPWSRPIVEASVGAEALKEDGISVHAGLDEHARMRALRPDLVAEGIVRAQPVTARNRADWIKLAQAPNWPGYFGSPRLATAELGGSLLRGVTERVNKLALDILDGADERKLPGMSRHGDGALNNEIMIRSRRHDAERERKQREWLERQRRSNE